MTTREPKTEDARSQGIVKGTSPSKRGTLEDDACRCKATSVMKPRELLGLMWSDLAFWKRRKKG